MVATPDCPDPARLKELLDGSLPSPEQTQLTSHLETCVNCQQALEGLAADRGAWAGTARHLADQPAAPEAALRQAMQELRGQASEATTLVGPGTRTEPDLDFLAPPDQPGQLGRLGPYEILEVLGRGGMGVVLKAFDPALRRTVAIKVLAPHLAANEINRKRFIREARAAAAVRHENVITVYGVDESGPLPFLVMEYVAGPSLQDLLDSGPLVLNDLLRLGAQVAGGLAAAHAQGLMHRDIKPSNILLAQPHAPARTTDFLASGSGSPGTAKITDFGLARAVDDVGLTQSGVVAGTPHYMAPEQARGEPVDQRADLFSLGSVLYAMCTGRPPFQGEITVAILYNVCQETPRPIQELNPAIPDALVGIIDKLHEKKPADRFASAAEVAQLLRQHLAHLERPTEAPLPEGPAKRVHEPALSEAELRKQLARIGSEYRSQTTIWGWPLVHIAKGIDPKTGKKRIAKGIIAIGDVSIGVLSLGGLAIGGIALGGCAIGLLAFGGLAVGVLVALGGGAIGGLALGGGAVGLIAVGGQVLGYYALGGEAHGVHALGGNIRDPQAVEFFRHWFGSWSKFEYLLK